MSLAMPSSLYSAPSLALTLATRPCIPPERRFVYLSEVGGEVLANCLLIRSWNRHFAQMFSHFSCCRSRPAARASLSRLCRATGRLSRRLLMLNSRLRARAPFAFDQAQPPMRACGGVLAAGPWCQRVTNTRPHLSFSVRLIRYLFVFCVFLLLAVLLTILFFSHQPRTGPTQRRRAINELAQHSGFVKFLSFAPRKRVSTASLHGITFSSDTVTPYLLAGTVLGHLSPVVLSEYASPAVQCLLLNSSFAGLQLTHVSRLLHVGVFSYVYFSLLPPK